MLNEGIVFNDDKTVVKSEIIRQLARLGRTTPDDLERAVFKALAGGTRDEIDWDIEDNKAGYFLWTKTFDSLISELDEDDYLGVENSLEGKHIVGIELDQGMEVSQLVYPPPPSTD
ncbi:MAG: hypothetical protein ABIF77_06050 [bacterium]